MTSGNLTHWFSPDRVWIGVMHIPLLVISLVALVTTAQKTKAVSP